MAEKAPFPLPKEPDLSLPGGMGVDDPMRGKFTALTDVINEFLKYLFPLAGLVLLGVLIMGGFQLLTSGGNPENVQKGKDKIVSGIIGFLILVLAYWIVEILGKVFGIEILGPAVPPTGNIGL